MARELIKTWEGKPLGWVETKPNGDVECRDWKGHIVGWYRKSTNTTVDFNNRPIFIGNAVTNLLKT